MSGVTDPTDVLIEAGWNQQRLCMVVVPVLLAIACIIEASFPSGTRPSTSAGGCVLFSDSSAALTTPPKRAPFLTAARVHLAITPATDLQFDSAGVRRSIAPESWGMAGAISFLGAHE